MRALETCQISTFLNTALEGVFFSGVFFPLDMMYWVKHGLHVGNRCVRLALGTPAELWTKRTEYAPFVDNCASKRIIESAPNLKAASTMPTMMCATRITLRGILSYFIARPFRRSARV